MKVADLMTRDAKTCVPSDTLDRTAHIMLAHDCGCVPVIDGEQRPVGIITDRDVAMAAFVSGRPLHDIDIERTMTGRLVTCRSTDSVESVRKVMGKEQVRRLPVVNADGRLEGIVSLSDLTQAAGSERSPATRRKESLAVFETLGVVSRPRDEKYFERFTTKSKTATRRKTAKTAKAAKAASGKPASTRTPAKRSHKVVAKTATKAKRKASTKSASKATGKSAAKRKSASASRKRSAKR